MLELDAERVVVGMTLDLSSAILSKAGHCVMGDDESNAQRIGQRDLSDGQLI